jgi:hypothetical protein
VNEAGFNTASFFDARGNVLPAANAFGQVAAPAVLQAQRSGTGLTLQWSLSGAGMTLASATNLPPPTPWQPVTNLVQNTGTWFNVTLPLDPGPHRFYRLQSN